MCGLCGALGGSQYWTDAAGRAEFEHTGARIVRRRERAQRVALLDAMLQLHGLRVRDWGGNSYVLEDAAGRRENVYNLAGIWAAADALAAEPVDPLAQSWLQAIEAGRGDA